MSEQPIYGMARIAEEMGISVSALRRVRKSPEGAFMEVGSMANDGGGFGRAVWTYPSSAQALKQTMIARVSEVRRRAAEIRWRATDVSSGPIVDKVEFTIT
jgi:hypothetical protein